MAACCPPGRGCNLHTAMQPCHRRCARCCQDREAIESMDFWWSRYTSLRWWKFRQRAEAHRMFVTWRDRALESGVRPPPRQMFVPLGAS